MTQNLVSTHFTAEQWAAVDEAIGTLMTALQPALVAVGKEGRRRLVKMGDGSEAFCRQALDVASEHAGMMPRNFNLDEMRRDLEAHDALNVRMVRLSQLVEKMRDTDLALGSDVMVASLEAYAHLKTAGRGEGLESLRTMLGRRFDNSQRQQQEQEAPRTPTAA